MKHFSFIVFILFSSLAAYAQESWEYFTSKQSVNCIDFEGDYVWIGTTGGIVKLDSRDNSTEEIDYNDNLEMLNIKAMAIDNSGVKWFASSSSYREMEGALFSFDGTNWVKYTKENSGLPSNMINDLSVDSKGKLYVGTNMGLVVLDNGIWEIATFENTAHEYILTISIDRDDNIWCGTIAGVIKYNHSSGQQTTYGIGSTNSIAFDNEGNAWCATDNNSIVIIKKDSIDSISPQNSEFPGGRVSKIFIDNNNNKWFVSYTGSTTWYYFFSKLDNNGSWEFYDTDNSILSTTNIHDMKIDAKNSIWFATENGLFKVDQTQWYNIPLPGIAPQMYIHSISIDSNDGILIGGWGGISYFRYNHLDNYYAHNSGLVTNLIYSSTLDQNNNIWVCTHLANRLYINNYISTLNENDWIIYDYNTDIVISANYITELFFDNQNILWFIKDGNIATFDGNLWQDIPNPDGFDRLNAKDITVDKHGNIWIAYYENGVFKYNNTEWTQFNTENSNLNSDRIYAVRVDMNNNIWVKTPEGISCYNGAEWENFENPSNNSYYENYNSNIEGLAIDSSGTIWQSTPEALFKFENETWTRIDSTDFGIQLNEINCIQIDKYNNKWLGTQYHGLIKLGKFTTGINETKSVAISGFHLLNNYPNPFNGITTLSYTLQNTGYVNITIYNMLGQKVVTLVDGYQTGLQNAIKWNGTNDFGEPVSSGIYFARMQCGDYTKTIKMAFVE